LDSEKIGAKGALGGETKGIWTDEELERGIEGFFPRSDSFEFNSDEFMISNSISSCDSFRRFLESFLVANCLIRKEIMTRMTNTKASAGPGMAMMKATQRGMMAAVGAREI